MKATQVQGFLDQATTQINAKVGSRYVLPVTAPDAQLILKMICVWLVAGRLRPILKIETGSGGKTGQSAGSDDYIKRAEGMLDDIQTGKTELLGAIPKTTGEGVDSGNARSGVSPKFKRDRDQW